MVSSRLITPQQNNTHDVTPPLPLDIRCNEKLIIC